MGEQVIHPHQRQDDTRKQQLIIRVRQLFRGVRALDVRWLRRSRFRLWRIRAQLARKQLIDRDAERLREQGQHGHFGISRARLPFADRLVGYHEPPGEFLLRQSMGFAPRRNERAGFLCIHLSHLPFSGSSIADLPPRRNRDAEQGPSTQRGAPFQIL